MIVRFIYLMTCLSFFVHGESIAQVLTQKTTSVKNGGISQFHPKDSKKELRKTAPPALIQKSLIIIDPGHGGHDVGTQSVSKPRYQEKSFNLITAQFVQSFLIQQGYSVFMTREDDTFVSLEKRAQIANKKKPALFVSIHYNSAPSAGAQGIEVFYYQSKENKERTIKSKRLAQSILKNVLSQTKANSRGIKHGNYAVIRETEMPAVLIEGGFLTNESELLKLKDPVYLKSLAWGIVKGIDEYLTPKSSSRKVPEAALKT